MTGLMAVVALALISMLFLTSANSAAMSMAMFSSGHANPHKFLRLFWALAMGAVAMVLCGTGNLKSIQTASILSALPLIALLVLALVSSFKGIETDAKGPKAADKTGGRPS